MREDYLHHLFNTRCLGNSFRTTTGAELLVQKFGHPNYNAGPDFPESQILLDDTTWFGSIEFHVRSSDWFVHGHQQDLRYNNVIAHFVYEHDREVFINGHKIPTVELKGCIDHEHYRRFKSLAESHKPVSCAGSLSGVRSVFVFQQKEKALVNRLMRKTDHILENLQRFNGDRERVFYHLLARTFGGKVNADAFENLLEKVDLIALRKLAGNAYAVPAILFGTAGLLPEASADAYTRNLIAEYKFQKHRLDLHPLNGEAFRFSRMHPPGFPTFRLAQFAAVLQNYPAVGYIVSGMADLSAIRDAFSVTLPDFWQTHYRFEKTTQWHDTAISTAFMDLIFINVIVPFVFAMGQLTDDDELKQKALGYLGQIHAEENSVIRSWKALNIQAENAFDSQALIEQKNEFCLKKRCLQCHIGHQVLKG